MGVVCTVALALLAGSAHIGIALGLTALLARPRRYRAGRGRDT